jgi:hypothetical protein
MLRPVEENDRFLHVSGNSRLRFDSLAEDFQGDGDTDSSAVLQVSRTVGLFRGYPPGRQVKPAGKILVQDIDPFAAEFEKH